jgi:hypothetical protein
MYPVQWLGCHVEATIIIATFTDTIFSFVSTIPMGGYGATVMDATQHNGMVQVRREHTR